MVRKLTQEEFINKAKSIHKDKFDYSLVKYINYKTKIVIKCNIFDIIFEQCPPDHLIYQKCSNCYKKNLHNEFVKKLHNIHGDKFEYLTEYTGNNNSKITFRCKDCLTISTKFINNLLNGSGCKTCWLMIIRCSQKDFINKAIKIHGNNFDYSLVEYINESTKIKIKCNICLTIFEQTPGGHIHHQHKCKQCAINNQTKTLEQFIYDAKLIHGNKYDYSLTNYVNANTKVKIKCNKCKTIFEQKPSVHTNLTCGCPICNNSKGEEKCLEILQNNKYVKEIISQFKFKECRNKLPLPFDFKVILNNENNTDFLIEYQGRQHYEETNFFTNSLEKQQLLDEIKYNYCKTNNINLLIIKYTEYDNAERVINEYITKMYQ